MAKNSFRHPVTGVLVAWGYVETNSPGEIRQEEPEDFALEPGRWRWDGTQWVPFVPVSVDRKADARAAINQVGGSVRAAFEEILKLL